MIMGALALSVCTAVSYVRAQSTYVYRPSSIEVSNAIDDAYNARKVPKGTASIIVNCLVHYGNNRYFDNSVAGNMTKSRSRKVASSAYTKPEKQLFELMYDAATSTPEYMEDTELQILGVKNGANLKKDVAKRLSGDNGQLRALESYSPEEVVTIYENFSQPWFTYDNDPYSRPTWAAVSLWYAKLDMCKAEMAKRSVVLRLLADQGKLDIPSSTSLDFFWSGAPSIFIDLSTIRWSKKDLTDLRRLSSNPLYYEAAQRQFNLIKYGMR
ncbi:MAG: hypothetical protein WCG02_03380 [Candidatus Taylorbacteria bacterium]